MTRALYLLDTNIISDMMTNADGPAARQAQHTLRQHSDAQLATSIIVQCELLYGLYKKPSPRLHRAYELQMDQLLILGFDTTIGATQHYAQLRAGLEASGLPMSGNDLLIAAHTLALDATLVSADAAFTRVPGLQVENWLRPLPHNVP